MRMPVFIIASLLAGSPPEEHEKVDVCVQWIPPSAANTIFVRNLQLELNAIFQHSSVTVIVTNCSHTASGIVIPCEVRGRCGGNSVYGDPDHQEDRPLLGWSHTPQSRTPGRIGIDCGAIASFLKQVRSIDPLERP